MVGYRPTSGAGSAVRAATVRAATVLAVTLLVAPRLAPAQGIAATDNGESQGMKFVAGGIGSNANSLGSAAAGGGVGNPLGLDSPPTSNLSLKDSADIGMAAAPALIKATQIPCTLSDARLTFSATGCVVAMQSKMTGART